MVSEGAVIWTMAPLMSGLWVGAAELNQPAEDAAPGFGRPNVYTGVHSFCAW